MEKQITINARKKTTSRGTAFFTYSSFINGKWYQIKFNKSAGERPEASGVYLFTVDTGDLSIAKGKQYTDRSGCARIENDTIWIAKYIDASKMSDEQLRKRDIDAINKIFGDEGLPF